MPDLPERFTHKQLAERARQLHPPIVSPIPHGDIIPGGMGGTPVQLDPAIHPSGGPHPQGNPGQPDALGTAVGPSFDRDALHSNLPERISTAEIAANAGRYGMDWSQKK